MMQNIQPIALTIAGLDPSGGAGIIADVESGTTVAGMPAVEIGLWRRTAGALLRLPELLRRVRRLEKSLGNSLKKLGPDTGDDAE